MANPGSAPGAACDAGIDLSDVIDAMGSASFETTLSSVLADRAGADHIAVYNFDGDLPRSLAAVSADGSDTARRQASLYLERMYWRRDPFHSGAAAANGGTRFARTQIAAIADDEMRGVIYERTRIQERVTICGRRPSGTICMNILRKQQSGAFSNSAVDWIERCADPLLSVLAKHYEIEARSGEGSDALTNLQEIERRLSLVKETLPRREAQVCARILYGQSAVGISLDLGLGEETIVTYRKRAFQRLGIASRRELLLWYLSSARSGGAGSARVHSSTDPVALLN